MAANHKYICTACEDVRVYFDGKIDTDKFRCPQCCDTSLVIAGFDKGDNLELFELMHQIDNLAERVNRLEMLLDSDPHVSVIN